VTHRLSHSSRRIWLLALALAAAALLTACGGQPATLNPDTTVAITRIDGTATLARAVGKNEGELPADAVLSAGDQLYTAANQAVTLQFRDGSTLRLAPDSHLVLFSVRPADHVAVFRLLAGSVTGDLRSDVFEVQGYEEVAMNFRMVATDLTAVLHSAAGVYQLGFEGNILKAAVKSGEFDMRSGNQQATLPLGWQAVAEPGKPLQVVSLITPTPASLSATAAPTATPIPIISITPTNTPTETPAATGTRAATATYTPTRTPTRVPRTIVISTATPTVVIIVDTPIPTATEKPEKKPKPTNPPPQPTEPPPKPTNPPQPTEPPPQPTKPPTLAPGKIPFTAG
jgi:hypothetical protein